MKQPQREQFEEILFSDFCITEILSEADAYGLRWEVETWAQKFLKENEELTQVQAYQLAYDEWIK